MPISILIYDADRIIHVFTDLCCSYPDVIFHPLPSPADPTGSYHSLGVANFDMDGDLDIFCGEQEDAAGPGMKTPGLKERGFFWVNTGGRRNPKFTISIIRPIIQDGMK